MRSDDATMTRAIFLVGMAMLGIALAVVVVRHRTSSPTGGATASTHHRLESPYQAMPFLRGAPQGQTLRAAGAALPRDLSQAYLLKGYTWLAITDVNTPTPTSIFAIPGIVAVPAEEAHYGFASFMAFGVDHHEEVPNADLAIRWIHNSAGVAYLARPLVAPSLDYGQVAALSGLDGIEIYDARVGKEIPDHADATSLWDRLLTDGHHLWGIVGDDSITASGPASVVGSTYVDVQVAHNDSALIADALKHGRYVDSTGVRVLGIDAAAGRITVITADADQVDFIGAGGALLATTHGSRGQYDVRWTETYVRAVARRSDGAVAWTQPVYVIP